MKKRLLIICDLDNTLYDWAGYFTRAFYRMVDEVVKITECDRERLLDDFREVHVRHADSEHPFSLLETRTISELYKNFSVDQIAKELNSAFHAFNSERKHGLKLYPGVRESLDELRLKNYIIVAHTEAKLFAATDRLDRLNILDYFSKIYCRERPKSSHFDPLVGEKWLDKFPLDKFVELSHSQRKPDTDVLVEICRQEGFAVSGTLYVGDSIARDMLMAETAGAVSVWAKYGTLDTAAVFEKLVRISHWSTDDIERESRLRHLAAGISPKIVLEEGFREILAHI